MSKLDKELFISGEYITIRDWLVRYSSSIIRKRNWQTEDALIEALEELDSGWGIDAEVSQAEENDLVSLVNKEVGR